MGGSRGLEYRATRMGHGTRTYQRGGYFHKHYITEVQRRAMSNTDKQGKQESPFSLGEEAELEPMALMISRI